MPVSEFYRRLRSDLDVLREVFYYENDFATSHDRALMHWHSKAKQYVSSDGLQNNDQCFQLLMILAALERLLGVRITEENCITAFTQVSRLRTQLASARRNHAALPFPHATELLWNEVELMFKQMEYFEHNREVRDEECIRINRNNALYFSLAYLVAGSDEYWLKWQSEHPQFATPDEALALYGLETVGQLSQE